MDRTIEQKQEELARHEQMTVDKDAMTEWLKQKRRLETELKALQEKHPVNNLQVMFMYTC